jgi:hypothetical protein
MISETGVVALVRASASQDGPGTMSDWLDRQLKAVTGQVMFPDWKAERRGATKFEVQYTFTLIDGANRIVKRGYAWTVDVPLSLVGPPRTISPEYAPAAGQRHDTRRVLQEQSSLE